MHKLCILCLFFVISTLFSLVKCSEYHEYCIIGAGPAGKIYLYTYLEAFKKFFFKGIQLAYFLHEAKRDYIVFERSHAPGAFFRKYPRHRKLISINKRNTGKL